MLIQRCIGEGGYASVYQVERVDLASTATLDANFTAALKVSYIFVKCSCNWQRLITMQVQSPPSISEFYIGTQLELRIAQAMVCAFRYLFVNFFV